MWFEDLFGFAEQSPAQVRKNLSIDGTRLTSLANNQSFDCGTLEIPTLEDLRISATEIANESTERTTLTQVVGNVQNLHEAAENRRAMFQVASQFNLLEMAAPDAVPEDGIGIYEHDYTQGPACAIAAGAGTVYRNYLVPLRNQTGQSTERQIDCLADIGKSLDNESQQLWKMQNGYAFASSAGLSIIAEHLSNLDTTSIDSLRSKLRVGIMWNTEVTVGKSANNSSPTSNMGSQPASLVSQIYCSAVPVSYSPEPASAWEPLARLILEATYEATLRAAVLNKARNGSNILFLTMIGGGAFGNQPEWIIDAIRRALRLHEHSGLDIRMVSHRHPNSMLDVLAEEF
ncbi:MAG: hypothetical protein ACR2N1_09430 [Rubripirellula sp.]